MALTKSITALKLWWTKLCRSYWPTDSIPAFSWWEIYFINIVRELAFMELIATSKNKQSPISHVHVEFNKPTTNQNDKHEEDKPAQCNSHTYDRINAIKYRPTRVLMGGELPWRASLLLRRGLVVKIQLDPGRTENCWNEHEFVLFQLHQNFFSMLLIQTNSEGSMSFLVCRCMWKWVLWSRIWAGRD